VGSVDKATSRVNYTLVGETINLLKEGESKIVFHQKQDYVMIVGKAGTGECWICNQFSKLRTEYLFLKWMKWMV
jgi:hypothetical protein